VRFVAATSFLTEKKRIHYDLPTTKAANKNFRFYLLCIYCKRKPESMKNPNSAAKSIVITVAAILFALLYIQMKPATPDEMLCSRESYGNRDLDSLYQGVNLSFLSAGHCDNCHGADPNGIANVTGEGADINLVDDWSSSMMANSAKDPFWRAKVSHEVLINPQFQSEIEGTCTKCHAPLGRYAAILNGEDEYHISDMLADSVALDGVSCLACHRQDPQPEVALHTGQLIFSPNLVAYGPYESPLISPMAQATGYIPQQASHIADSKLCAGCHSLVTETIDLEGNLTGDEFVEQATWHEWLNSSYPDQNISCQGCHLPTLPGENIILATGYDTPPRPNFSLHTMAGGNTLMLALMRDNREALGIFASEAQFNETIAATNHQLQDLSLELQIINSTRTADSLFIDVQLRNKTGHKLPSGYPARRMSVHFVLTDENGNEIFRSGAFDDDYAVVEETTPLEPHHNIINSEDQVQIYEMVMGDVENNRTTVLTRGYTHLKDNRLVPLGFSTANPVYDTTAIVLNTPDPDFNYNPNEGSGTDVIHYRIPANGYQGIAQAQVKVYYQSLPPVWLSDILSLSTPEIDAFNEMFANADKSPVLMETASTSIPAFVGVSESQLNSNVQIMYDVASNPRLFAQAPFELSLYTVDGKLIETKRFPAGQVNLKDYFSGGIYLAVIRASNSNKMQVEKILIK
jgi:hypothetical protein